MTDPATDLFRAEALESHRVQDGGRGDLLRISPRWLNGCYWLLVAIVAAGGLFLVIGTIHEYESGPAIVRVEGRIDLTAKIAGTVSSVDVQPGERIAAGQVLVRFYEAREAAELDRLNREFELQMIQFLRSPSDPSVRQPLASLRAERELAKVRMEERLVRASQAGIVSDIRIRPGQLLAAGEVILSLVGEESMFSVIAMLPGHARPLLRPGAPMRLELSGYRYAYQDLAAEQIGDEVVGPAEVGRFLGREIADTLPLRGPVVLVKARLPERTFVAEGRMFHYYEGMQGTIEARVRSSRIILVLIPGLKALFEYARG